MSRIERSNENYKISYSSKRKIAVATEMTKNRKRVHENDEIYSRAERKGATKTTNLTKMTKNRKRVDENDEIYSRTEICSQSCDRCLYYLP